MAWVRHERGRRMTRLARGMTSVTTMGILAAVLIATLAVVAWLRRRPEPIPQREQTTLDSLMATAPAFSAHRDTVVRVETLSVTRSAQNARQAVSAQRIADSLHRITDEAQQAAAASGEQSERWFTVAEVRRVENDSLRSAIVLLDTALAQQTTARLAASDRANAAEQRLAATADLSKRLATDIKRGDCRLLVVLSCPSRRATLAIGLTGGAIAAIAIDRRVGR